MKKIIFIAFVMLFVNLACFASEKFTVNVLPNESYIILLKYPASVVMVSDKSILKSEVLTTLYNEKNQILVSSLNEGKARLYISMKNDDVSIIEFNSNKANEDKTLKLNSDFIQSVFKLDIAGKINMKNDFPFELDEPPALRGGR